MKPIYKPKGAAKEYGDYALNIYTVKEVDVTKLAGYINEDGREFYLTYDKDSGSADVTKDCLFLTRAEAEEALKEARHE